MMTSPVATGGACGSASTVTGSFPFPLSVRAVLPRSLCNATGMFRAVAQPASASAEGSFVRAEIALLVLGLLAVTLAGLWASGGDVRGWERSVFRAINDLPEFMYR